LSRPVNGEDPATKKASANPAAPQKPAERVVTGRVLGPKGEVVKGTRVFLCPRDKGSPVAEVRVAADGSFRLPFETGRVPGGEARPTWPGGQLLAPAPGLGRVWTGLGDVTKAGWQARLVPAGVAVEGTLTTLEGKPLAGAEVTLVSLQEWEPAKLDEYLAAL